MNKFQMFLNNCAVIEIRRYYRNDLYNFCKLIEKMGFLDTEINHFEKVMKIKEENTTLEESYSDDYFWHIVDLNTKTHNAYIEYQYGKGFTFGGSNDYKNEEDYIKVSIDDIIVSCGKDTEFNLNYIETFFKDELKDKKDLAQELDYFCDWYEWRLVKYSDKTYNILDIQTDEFDFEKSVTIDEIIKRVFGRMVDYYTDEEEHEILSFTQKTIINYINLARKYQLLSNDYIEYLYKWFENERKYLK